MAIEFADKVIRYSDSGTGAFSGPQGFDVLTGEVAVLKKVPLSFALGPEPAANREQGLTLPSGSFVDVGFTGNRAIVDRAGADIFVSESGAAGDRAAIYVSNDDANFVLAGHATGGTETAIDISNLNLNNIITIRILSLNDAGYLPGFDVVNVRANTGPLPVPQPPRDPEAHDDFFAASPGREVQGNVLADNGSGADRDLGNQGLTVVARTKTTAEGGQFTVSADGSFVYTPTAGFEGTDTVTYRVRDPNGNADTGLVTFLLSECGATQEGDATNETFNGTGCDDTIDGKGGNDTIYGFGGRDTLLGAQGNDVLFGGADDDRLDGGMHADTLYGNGGDDQFLVQDASMETDILFGGAGRDVVRNTGGDDFFLGRWVERWGGVEVINGAGHNIVVRNSHTLDLSDLKLIKTKAILSDATDNTITGTAFDDRIISGGGNDVSRGGDGNDTIIGGVNIDHVEGGKGDDTLDGGAGLSPDTVFGNSGNDVFQGAANDLLNDTLIGGKGRDIVINTGSDTLVLGNKVSDWKGIALIDLGGQSLGAQSRQVLDLKGLKLKNIAEIEGLGDNNTILATGGRDLIRAGDGNNTVDGRGGRDTIEGGANIDILNGGAGKDRIDAGGSPDQITGGRGGDRLTGGTGGDDFIYKSAADSRAGKTSQDRITDFEVGIDDLDVSAIDAVAGGADDAFTWIGVSGFSGAAGELRLAQIGGSNGTNWKVEGDIDGDRAADFQIRLNGLGTTTDFGAGDIIL